MSIYNKPFNPPEPVSIILCARNEAGNLEKTLPVLLRQDYPEYEVIVVNDRSEDETREVLNRFAIQYKHLKISEVRNDPVFTHGKKLALTLGIKEAANEWLLLTDADCMPAGDKWLYRMQQNFTKDKSLVLGYGGYKKEKGFVNLLTRIETVFTAMQYTGMAAAGKPYMGVGRNLAYRKSLFFNNKGFASHSRLTSGDDDLFVNETADKSNTAVELHPESFTWSESEKSFRNWFYQKKRHLSVAGKYSFPARFRLVLESTSRVFYLISFVYLMVFFPYREYIAGLYGLLFVIKGIVYKIVFTRLNESLLFIPSLFIISWLPVIYGYMHFINLIQGKRKKWN